jgi:hypothetical protein
MKIEILALMLFLGTSVTSYGSIKKCLQQVAINEKWSPLTESQVECMKGKEDFNSAINALCSPDQSEISQPYSKFLDLKKRIDAAFAKFQAATNPGERALANAELQDLKQAQSSYATANGIWDALNLMNSSRYFCE